VDCPDCQAGGTPCPACAGKPVETQEIVCPACKGEKTIHCTTCGGTGMKPLPPIDKSEEKKDVVPPAGK
jgi:RecJ-like exonuclease